MVGCTVTAKADHTIDNIDPGLDGSQRAAGLNLIRNGHRDLNAIQTGIDVVDRVVGLSRYRAACLLYTSRCV